MQIKTEQLNDLIEMIEPEILMQITKKIQSRRKSLRRKTGSQNRTKTPEPRQEVQRLTTEESEMAITLRRIVEMISNHKAIDVIDTLTTPGAMELLQSQKGAKAKVNT